MPDLEKFRLLGLSETSLNAIEKKGFEEPTPIQEQTIPLLLSGEKDMIGQAQTGTGKTAAFGLPILEIVNPGNTSPQALILSPTRELSLQIVDELNSLKGEKKLSVAALYGGQSIEIQLKALKRGVDIAVGTPGRIIDLLDRQALNLSQVSTVILDEADEMLDMGFIEDIENILKNTPNEKRMLMFSATMPEPILKIAKQFMRPDFEIIRTEQEHLAVDLTDQVYFEVRRDDKLEALSRILDINENVYAMVFCRTKNDVDELTENLMYRGYPVEALHGDIAQIHRTKVINRFRAHKFNVLIATDVAARGIDISNLTHVINYSIPQSTEAYVHRIGRTGRAGKQGTAITFVTPSEFRLLSRIKREANTEIRRANIPSAEEIVEAKRQRVSVKLSELIAEEKHKDYLSFSEQLITTVNHPAEVIAALLKMKYGDDLLISSYSNISFDSRKEKRETEHVSNQVDRTRLMLHAGRNDGYGPAEILQLIYDQSGVWKCNIGRIDIFDDFSYVNVNSDCVSKITDSFRNFEPEIEIAKTIPADIHEIIQNNDKSSDRKKGSSGTKRDKFSKHRDTKGSRFESERHEKRGSSRGDMQKYTADRGSRTGRYEKQDSFMQGSGKREKFSQNRDIKRSFMDKIRNEFSDEMESFDKAVSHDKRRMRKRK